MNTDTLEKQYDALVAKSCDNKNRISNTNEHILKINDEIDDVKKEIKNICNVDIVTEKHYVDMYEREIDINTKLYKDLRKKNKALKKKVEAMEFKTHNTLNASIQQLSNFYTKNRPNQMKKIHEEIQSSKDIEKKRSMLEKQLKDEELKQRDLQIELSKSKEILCNLDEKLFDLSAILIEENQHSNVNLKKQQILKLNQKKATLERRYNQLQSEYNRI